MMEQKLTPNKQEIENRIFDIIKTTSVEELSHTLKSLSNEIVWLEGETYYIPATDSYFTVEVDGNYYHGYEILIHKRTKSELERKKQINMDRETLWQAKPSTREEPRMLERETLETMANGNLRCEKKYLGGGEYVWFSYQSGNTESETEILCMLNQCGAQFSRIFLSETHDLGDENWYRGEFHSLAELMADKSNKKLCEWNVYGGYGEKEIFVHFKGWNIFGGVGIRCKAKDEATVTHLLQAFEQHFCVATNDER